MNETPEKYKNPPKVIVNTKAKSIRGSWKLLLANILFVIGQK